MDSSGAAPIVTVVVVTWNGAHLLRPCLQSLQAQTLPTSAYQVVVVDNASQDETLGLLATEFPDVDVVVSDRNLGFAGGANLGLRRSSTPFVVLLNNDATAEPGMLEALAAELTRPEAADVAAVTAKVLLSDRPLVNSTGNLVSRTGRGFDRDWLEPDDGSRAAGEVFGFCGAAAALRMSALADVGLFDEDLFLYYEDTDLSWRLRAAGWTVRFEPAAVAIHRHAATSDAGSALFHYWNERNSLIVFTRHAPWSVVLKVLARRAAGLVAHTVRDGPLAAVTRARWRAFAHFIRRLPRTLSERRGMWSNARTPRSVVAELLSVRPTP